MSTESRDFDHYAIVLADLKAKRDQIDQAIQAIESLRSGMPGGGTSLPNPSNLTDQDPAGAYLGMSIAEAAKKLLASRRKQLNNSEILAALKAGGLVLNSVEPLNTIGAVLTRRFNEVGDIVRVDRGTWGLKEWYPNRSFAKSKGNGDTESKPSSESAPHAKPASGGPQT